MSTCHDCKGRFDADSMVLIKTSSLSGRALICEECHQAEVAKIRAINIEIQREAGR